MKQDRKNSERLGTEPVLSLLVKLSIPSILSMAIQALYNVIDSIYVGHLSKDALSALSLAFPIQMVIIAIAVGTGVGTSSLISRLLGKNDSQLAANAAEHVLFIAVVYGVCSLLVGLFFSREIIDIFTDDPNLIQMGSEYIRIILIGSIAMFIPMLSNNILRGQGNTFIPMITMLIGSVLNMVLDPFFIFGIGFFPEWGVSGAAFATVLSRIISGSFAVYILFSNKNELHLDLKKFRPDYSIIKSIYSVGFPAMVMQLLGSVMLAFMNIILGGFSNTAIAAGGIYFRLQSFVFMPIFGLNQGFLPIIGYNFGHRNKNRIRKVIKYAFLFAIAYTFFCLIIFQIFPRILVLMFNPNPELVSIGTQALRIISYSFPLAGLTIIGASIFQSFGKGLPSLLLSLLRMILLLIPLMYLLSRTLGLNGVWLAFPITELLTVIPGFAWLALFLKKIYIETDTLSD